MYPVTGYGQNGKIKVPLSKTYIINNTFPKEKNVLAFNEKTTVKTDLLLNSFAVFEAITNFKEEFYINYYKNRVIPDSIFSLILERRGWTNDFYQTFNNQNRVSILTGLTDTNNFVVIPDTNNDGDFSNDIVFSYNIFDSIKKKISLSNIVFNNVPYRITETQIEDISIVIDIEVSPNFTDLKKSTVTINNNKYWTGVLDVSGKNQTFFVDLISLGYDFPSATDVKINIGNQQNIINYIDSDKDFYSINETFWINNYKFSFDSVSAFGNFAYFFLLDSIVTPKTTRFDKLSLKNIISKNNEPIIIEKSKYYLIDIWATWCIPCIEQHKILNKLSSENSFRNLEIIGVLKDDSVNISKGKKYIKENGFKWRNFYTPPSGINDSEPLLRNSVFPTYILINGQGDIYMKSNTLEKVLSYFKEKLANPTF